MIIYFSPSTKGFYHEGVQAPENIPNDAIEITEAVYQALLADQSAGKEIVIDIDGITPISKIREVTIDTLINGVQSFLDSKAQEKGYDDIRSAALRSAYVGPYQAEGIIYAQWMDSCWEYCYQVKADVEATTRTMPTVAELILELPILNLV